MDSKKIVEQFRQGIDLAELSSHFEIHESDEYVLATIWDGGVQIFEVGYTLDSHGFHVRNISEGEVSIYFEGTILEDRQVNMIADIMMMTLKGM